MRHRVLSQSCSLLAHVAVLPTHTPTFIYLHITALWQHVHTAGLPRFYKNTHTHHCRHYLTKSSLTLSEENGSVQQCIWPSSDTHSESAMPRFCLHKQEPVPVCCIIQTWLAPWMNNQLVEVMWGESADSKQWNNQRCVLFVCLRAYVILILFSLIVTIL